MKPKLILCLALVLSGGLFVVRANEAVAKASSAQMVGEFKNSRVFWRQFQMASNIVALGNTNVLQELTSCLTNDDRHVRGNAAFIFAGLGDDRGFEVIREILNDRSERSNGQGVPGINWPLQAQIASDRYYAVHLFGDLKNLRAVPILIPLLSDKEVNYVVPWALGEIGDKRAIHPLIEALSDTNPSVRVLAIYALETLKAREALPRLQQLLNDKDRTDFGDLATVADAADEAIIELKPPQDAIAHFNLFLNIEGNAGRDTGCFMQVAFLLVRLRPREMKANWKLYLQLFWETGEAQSDAASMTAEDVDWQSQTITCAKKSATDEHRTLAKAMLNVKDVNVTKPGTTVRLTLPRS
jgi:hypothetical protein